MRLVLAACVLAACSAHAAAPVVARLVGAAPAMVVAPGLRLPEDVTPLRYALRLEVDPERDTFHGEVQIRVRIDAPTDHVWLHARDLEITRATYDGHPLAMLPVAGDQMRAFGFGRTLGRGTVTLALAYTGHTDGDEEGLFRERAGAHWYLFSQGEAVYARRITPCFDEPRFKTPWKVTLVVPAADVALGNMPAVRERVLADGRREVELAATPAMPSYLLAVAVGPFELVDAGTVGRRHVPVRIAALAGERDRVGVVAAQLPAIVGAVEDYLDDALPWPKLDLVVVPHLFGAMENPGLVTFDRALLVGDGRDRDLRDAFVRTAAHEVVHQWFGNLVTPAWWNDLWMSEAFASWLGGKVTAQLGAAEDPVLERALARERALAADAQPGARPLRRAITSNEDPDASFDAISYDEGPAVLATFERWVGPARFRTALLGYLRGHRGGTAAAPDVVAAIAGASSPEVGRAFAGYLAHAGAPVVELALRCDGAPALAAHARGGLVVPACVRYPSEHGARRTCALVGDHTRVPLPGAAGCPAWVVGNDGAAYYEVAGGWPPVAVLSPGERIALGDDVAAAVARGELPAEDALRELRALAGAHDGYARYGALAIAHALDPLVGAAARPAWTRWLAAAFADRLTPTTVLAPAHAVDREVRDGLIALLPGQLPPAVVRAARRTLDAELARGMADPGLIAIAAPAAGRALFDRLAALAGTTGDGELRAALLDALGDFGPGVVDHAVERLAGGDAPVAAAWPAVAGYLARPGTRTAAWAAVRARLGAILARLTGAQATALIGATAALCDPAARREVTEAFASRAASFPGGPHALASALSAIDRCIARRAHLGDVAAALARVR